MNSSSKTRSGTPDELYLPGERIPVPEAKERDTESAWAMFDALSKGTGPGFEATAQGDMAALDSAYARTEPSPLASAGHAAGGSPRGITVEDVLLEARRNNRVCPLPPHWVQLYEMLPDKKRTARGWEPAPPITGPAWVTTPSMPKRMFLRDHIEWAAAHGALDAVMAFLKSLPEDQWHHMGD